MVWKDRFELLKNGVRLFDQFGMLGGLAALERLFFFEIVFIIVCHGMETPPTPLLVPMDCKMQV
jgi:hypothetical protein